MEDILGSNFSYSGVYTEQQNKTHQVVKRGAARGLTKWTVTKDDGNFVIPYQIESSMSKNWFA